MTVPEMNPRHPDDGEIIELIDGELAPEKSWVTEHVAECSECSARVAIRRRQGALFSQALSALPVAEVNPDRIWPGTDDISRARRRRETKPVWKRSTFRAAAGIVVLAGVAAAGPVGRWISERIADGRAGSEVVEPRGATTPEPGVTSAPAVTSVGFPVTGSTLSLRFAQRPANGSITIVSGDFAQVNAEAVGIGADESFLVLPDGLQIRNSTTSQASYEIELPRSIRNVTLTIGTEQSRTILIVPGSKTDIRL